MSQISVWTYLLQAYNCTVDLLSKGQKTERKNPEKNN